MNQYHSSPSRRSNRHFSVGNASLIGMIRARKIAIKIKKRAQFLVAYKHLQENTGRAMVVHHDNPRGKEMYLSPSQYNAISSATSSTERLHTSSSSGQQKSCNNAHNTGPENIFPVSIIKKNIETILAVRLDKIKNNSSTNYKELSKNLAEEIKQDVKTLHEFTRYKIICIVNIGEITGQCNVRFGSRCLWNVNFDNFASAFYRNNHIFAVATVYGIYFE